MSKKLTYRELQKKCTQNKDIVDVKCNGSTKVLREALEKAGLLDGDEEMLEPKRRPLTKKRKTVKPPTRPPPPRPKTVRPPSRPPPSRPKKKVNNVEKLRLDLLKSGNLPTVIEMCRIDEDWKDQCNALDLWSYLMKKDFPGGKTYTFNRYLTLYRKNFDILPVFVNFGTERKIKAKNVTIAQILGIFVTDVGTESGLGMLELDNYIFQLAPAKTIKYAGGIQLYFNVNEWSFEDGLIKNSNIGKQFVAVMNSYFSNTQSKDLRKVATEFYTQTFRGKELTTVKEDLRNVNYCKIRFSISTTAFLK